MPVTRCTTCGRGLAGYFDSERQLFDTTLDEVQIEILKYQAKVARIREYISELRAGATPEPCGAGKVCPGCGQGWREFDSHSKNLEQLFLTEAIAALGANTRWLNQLINRRSIVRLGMTPTGENQSTSARHH